METIAKRCKDPLRFAEASRGPSRFYPISVWMFSGFYFWFKKKKKSRCATPTFLQCFNIVWNC